MLQKLSNGYVNTPFWMRTLSNVKGFDSSEKICLLYSLAQVTMINRMSAAIKDVLEMMVTSMTNVSANIIQHSCI